MVIMWYVIRSDTAFSLYTGSAYEIEQTRAYYIKFFSYHAQLEFWETIQYSTINFKHAQKMLHLLTAGV